jgi:hypothetical protein
MLPGVGWMIEGTANGHRLLGGVTKMLWNRKRRWMYSTVNVLDITELW